MPTSSVLATTFSCDVNPGMIEPTNQNILHRDLPTSVVLVLSLLPYEGCLCPSIHFEVF